MSDLLYTPHLPDTSGWECDDFQGALQGSCILWSLQEKVGLMDNDLENVAVEFVSDLWAGLIMVGVAFLFPGFLFFSVGA